MRQVSRKPGNSPSVLIVGIPCLHQKMRQAFLNALYLSTCRQLRRHHEWLTCGRLVRLEEAVVDHSRGTENGIK